MTQWVRRLIVANVAVFVLTMTVPELYGSLAFVPGLVLYRPWTLFTYMFVHAPGFAHIFFNMLGLFFFGSRLELRLGARSFLWLYFLSGLGGAVLSFFFAPMSAVVGASGAVFGVLYGFARFWPTDEIYIWGVLPIQARWLVVGLAAMALYSGVSGAGSGIAHFAHLGGFVGGWAYLRVWERRQLRRRPATAHTTIEVVSGKAKREEEQWRAVRLETLHEINRAEVERILRKLDESGARGLTPEERAFMNRMCGGG
ncbi:MAG TPA: rhomboid family intramembrane serine protease [Longimicrobiales bacterium]